MVWLYYFRYYILSCLRSIKWYFHWFLPLTLFLAVYYRALVCCLGPRLLPSTWDQYSGCHLLCWCRTCPDDIGSPSDDSTDNKYKWMNRRHKFSGLQRCIEPDMCCGVQYSHKKCTKYIIGFPICGLSNKCLALEESTTMSQWYFKAIFTPLIYAISVILILYDPISICVYIKIWWIHEHEGEMSQDPDTWIQKMMIQ